MKCLRDEAVGRRKAGGGRVRAGEGEKSGSEEYLGYSRVVSRLCIGV